jgi:hypothetical protein
MSILGKVLLVLNVLAAIGFFVMAGMDWSKRYEWANSALVQRLVIEGLPVDDHEPDLEGNPRVKDFRKDALDKLFQSAGGSPSKTQAEEVERVKGEIQKWVEDTAHKGTKTQRLAQVLMHLTQSMKDRDELKALGENEKNEGTLQNKLDEWFTGALVPPPAGNAPPKLDRDVQREKIAHLLFCCADLLRQDEGTPPPGLIASKAYQRALATIGIKECAGEIQRETAVLSRFTDDVKDGMDRDRTAFVEAHRTLVAQIEDLADKCERQKSILKFHQELVDKQRTLANIRENEVIQMEKDLAAARDATAEQLKIQNAMEAQLFKNRRDQRTTFETNLKLERQLRSLEKGR